MKRFVCLLLAALSAALLFSACGKKNEGPVDSRLPKSLPLPDDTFGYEETEGGMMVTSYNGYGVEVVIPEKIKGKKVVAIGKEAFAGSAELQGVLIPNTVKKIGESAFAGCQRMRTLIVGTGVEEIGVQAFASCYELGAVYQESRVLKVLGQGAFKACASMQRIDLPDSLERVDADAFAGCVTLIIAASEGSFAYKYAVENNFSTIGY